MQCRNDVEQQFKPPKSPKDRSGWSWNNAKVFSTTDYFALHSQLSLDRWTSKYGSFKQDEILMLFGLIEDYFPKPRDTRLKKLNKFLMWLHFVHCDDSQWQSFTEKWAGISNSSCIEFCNHVMTALLCAFYGTSEIMDIPLDSVIRKKMHDILELEKARFTTALISIDGKASRMLGRKHKNRRCWKFKFRPAQNHMCIYDRVLGLALASSIGNGGNMHDITVFRNHHWCNSISDKLGKYSMLADSGYVGVNGQNIAVRPKKNQNLYHTQTKEFWNDHSGARSHIEHEYGRFWVNQFPTLNFWKRNSKSAFQKKRITIFCCLIIMNVVRLYRLNKINT